MKLMKKKHTVTKSKESLDIHATGVALAYRIYGTFLVQLGLKLVQIVSRVHIIHLALRTFIVVNFRKVPHFLPDSFEFHEGNKLLFEFFFHLPKHLIYGKVDDGDVTKVKVIGSSIFFEVEQNRFNFFIPVKVHLLFLLLEIT